MKKQVSAIGENYFEGGFHHGKQLYATLRPLSVGGHGRSAANRLQRGQSENRHGTENSGGEHLRPDGPDGKQGQHGDSKQSG